MTDRLKNTILVLNAGSSSLKFAVFSIDSQSNPVKILTGQIDQINTNPHFKVQDQSKKIVANTPWQQEGKAWDHVQIFDRLWNWLTGHLADRYTLIAAGHRVVHGGSQFKQAVQVNQKNFDELEKLTTFAPLHQPYNLAPIQALWQYAPNLPQVVCLDTAFHAEQPSESKRLALPRSFYDQGIYRYGFHGLSYHSIVTRWETLTGQPLPPRLIVAHLGNGASACAIQHGKSIANTMGFTPLDGLVMGTRCGSIDPGVLLHLLNKGQMTPAELHNLLYHQSGLLGISGISSDMRTLLASNDPNAQEAIDLFVYQLVKHLGSLIAVLGGLDALVFTGGIGENAPTIRQQVCESFAWLNLKIDTRANEQNAQKISTNESPITVWNLPADEEQLIVTQVCQVLGFA